MKTKLLIVSGMVLSLMFLFQLNYYFDCSGTIHSLDKASDRGGVVAEAAEVASDGSISGDVEGKYQVRIFIEGTLVETRYFSYGEKLIIENYSYYGVVVHKWSYKLFFTDANGGLIGIENVDVNNKSLEVMITQNLDISGKITEMRPGYGMYLQQLVDEWEQYGYPEYIGGAYGQGLDWRIYLKENTLAKQNLIEAKIYNGHNITYISCNFSHKDLVDVRDKIIKNYVSTGSGIRSISIACHQWQDGVTEPRVLVVMEGLKNYDSFAEKFYSQYGNKVVVGVYDAISGVTYPAHAPEKVTVKSAKVKKKKLVIKWKKAKEASKYQIQIFRGKKKIKTVSVKKLSFKYSLKKKKAGKYYVKVRAYGKEAKRWGNWSKKTKAK